jgi:hypothetical protein
VLLQLCCCNSVHRECELSQRWPALAAQLDNNSMLEDKLATAQGRVAKLTERISDVSDAMLISINSFFLQLLF